MSINASPGTVKIMLFGKVGTTKLKASPSGTLAPTTRAPTHVASVKLPTRLRPR